MIIFFFCLVDLLHLGTLATALLHSGVRQVGVTILIYYWGSLVKDMVYLLVFYYHLLGLLFEIVNNVAVANSLKAGVKITSLLSNKL